MVKQVKPERKPNLLQIIKRIGENLKTVLDEEKESEYFENIVLNYGLIENLLKYDIFLKLTWDQTGFAVDHSIPRDESFKMYKISNDFCSKLTFYHAGEIALSIGLIDFSLYQKIVQIRKKRNNLLHQYWLFEHKDSPKKLKRTLQEDIEVSKELIRILLKLHRKIGSNAVFDISMFFKISNY